MSGHDHHTHYLPAQTGMAYQVKVTAHGMQGMYEGCWKYVAMTTKDPCHVQLDDKVYNQHAASVQRQPMLPTTH